MQTENRKKPKSPEYKPEKDQQKPQLNLLLNKLVDSSISVIKKPKKLE
jgi:hypothetical protein